MFVNIRIYTQKHKTTFLGKHTQFCAYPHQISQDVNLWYHNQAVEAEGIPYFK